MKECVAISISSDHLFAGRSRSPLACVCVGQAATMKKALPDPWQRLFLLLGKHPHKLKTQVSV
jgi:hypothetical protein